MTLRSGQGIATTRWREDVEIDDTSWGPAIDMSDPDPLRPPETDEEPWGTHSGPTWNLDGIVVCEACGPVTTPRHIPWRWLALAVLFLAAWRLLR